jgi:two-component system chemotaxis response regulator CheB
VLAQILGQLGRNFPLPIVIVQHLAQGFVQHLAGWLGDCSELTVKAASDGCRLLPGTVLLAPDDRHVSFESRERVVLGSEPEQCHYRPSADVLFSSAADCFGSDAIGVILSGMGRDGADGLKVLREAGALTIAQSAESCAVDGMPRAARDIGAATCALSPLLIGPRIIDGARRIVLNARTRPGK